ncbi:MAG: hypothetical protein Q8J78_15690 [Moraxellaceae bacterium]|nr:hypothetical protein [Moraxellaceae bacterium]
MNKNSLMRFCRKTTLIFELEKKRRTEKFLGEVRDVLGDDFEPLTEKELLAINVGFDRKGRHWQGVGGFHGERSFYIRHDSKEDFFLVPEEIAESWLVCLPLYWASLGGGLVKCDSFFSNFLELSRLMDDEFILLSGGFNSSFQISGDQRMSHTSFELYVGGDEFRFALESGD